jgi:cob(I)alamin adenosyltransferase
MVKLNRITTRGGDRGSTSLGDGSRVEKDCARVEAYGALDELSAHLGVARSTLDSGSKLNELLATLQHRLFDLGADLCVPGSTGDAARVNSKYTLELEAHLEEWNRSLPELGGFVLSGGTPTAASLHLARTVCRRVERRVWTLIKEEGEGVNPEVLIWLNRLSDLLFVLARSANMPAKEELWIPADAPSKL